MQGGLTKFRILFHCLLDGGQFKMSQSKEAKAATVKGREEAPAAPAPEPPPQPRDATRAEKEEMGRKAPGGI